MKRTPDISRTPPAQDARRAPEQSQISISLSKDLLSRIDDAAKAENRNRSNFISTHMERIVGEVAEEGREKKKKKKKG
ncbi:MAG TPA: ribbon-helix-helix protein, CopG family [Opitutales bacterium]|nr:ribbon-helix-helix protein, CopG family [Opitutales bacterium]